jgi:phage-related protein
VFDVLGTVLTGVVIPAFEVIFTVLGKVAELIGPLVEAALPGLEAGFRLVGDAITWLIEKVTAAVEWLGRVKDRAIEMKNAVTGAFGDMTSSVTGFAEDAYDGVTGWFGDMYDYVVGNSVVPDMVKGVLGEFDSMSGGMVELVSGAVGGVKSVMTDIANAVGSKFEEITGISLSGIRSQVESMSSTIQSSVSSLTSWVSSSLSGVWNSISNTAGRVGDWFGGFDFSNPFENFAGFFANGGRIPAGQFGVVGEAGPELVSGPANVTPMGDQFGTMVTYNINAVDASSFRALLAQDPGFVHRVVQRGAATATGRR